MECTKVLFSDEKSANIYIAKLRRTSSRSIKPIRAYLCEKCLNWHLTSIESRENMQIVYKDREIANLKTKIDVVKAENELIKDLLNKLKSENMVSIVGDEWIDDCLCKLQ